MNRFGRRLAELRELQLELPVGRAGTPFRAQLSTDTLTGLDMAQLRFFVVEDDAGDRYPAMIERVTAAADDPRTSIISGIVVADGLKGR